MDLAGNEKKIQALFRELKLADQRFAPEFIGVWNRAQTTISGRQAEFSKWFAVVTALFVITLSAFALWSRSWQRNGTSNPSVAVVPLGPGTTPASSVATPEPKQLAVAEPRNRVKTHRRDRKLAARHQAAMSAGNAVIHEGVAMSRWQSPTATLMESPADDVLISLPQLHRALTELKTFLPNTSQ